MENRSFNSDCDVLGKLDRKNVQIRLLGHCIICLRKVSFNGKGNWGTSDGDDFSAPEIAPKSVVTTPGFLSTFNQVWTVLLTKWKEKKSTNRDGNGSSSKEIGISLEKILQSGGGSTNVSFSKAPTFCQLCCDKILAVENLMKAVRQQVREIYMLLEHGRRRQAGGLGELEKSLRGNGLEDSVIRATLQFVGILELEPIRSQDNFKEDLTGDDEADNVANILDLECDEDSSFTNSQMYNNDKNEGQTRESGAEDDDNALVDYIKSEVEEDNEDDDDARSEEEMEVSEEDDKSDPDYQVDNDPLSFIPPKKRKIDKPSPRKWATKFTSDDQEMTANEDDSKIRCSCGKIFGKMKTLREHMRRNKNIHPEYQPFKGTVLGNRQVCELCGQWAMRNDILGHLTRAHLNGQAEWVIRCPNDKCPYMFVSSKEFHLHFHRFNTKNCKKIWKEKGGGHVCEACGFKGTNLINIRKHVRDKHENGEEKKWTCPISDCGKRFCVKQSVHLHMHEHRIRRITNQNCDKCGESLKIEEMKGHLKDKHGIEEVIGCGQCEMKFSGREEMIEHLYEHREVGILCDICGDTQDKFVSRYSDFREHYFVIHQLYPKKYKCGECDKWYWRMADKEEHELRIHRKESAKSVRYRAKNKVMEKNYECEICSIKFLRDAHLTNHNIKLHGADPYKCDTCGETFDKQVKFNKHRKEHAGIPFQKEWKCEVEGCGKIFKAKRNWRWHVKSGHGAVKPHVCELCGKGYTGAAGLREHHDIVHLGKREWVCDECGERFGSSTILKNHKLIHTGERPFGCDICGQRFRHKEVLRRHLVGHEEKGAGFKPNGPMKQIRKRKAQ